MVNDNEKHGINNGLTWNPPLKQGLLSFLYVFFLLQARRSSKFTKSSQENLAEEPPLQENAYEPPPSLNESPKTPFIG